MLHAIRSSEERYSAHERRVCQVGCFVPAEFAALRTVDRLFTRIGMSDSIETNSSTFMVEMTVPRPCSACLRALPAAHLDMHLGTGVLCDRRPHTS